MKTSSFQANASPSATWGMVITGADLWMLLNPLQVQIKSITAKPGSVHKGIVYSNPFPVCSEMHNGTTFRKWSLKKIKMENNKQSNLQFTCIL